jgi:hypothetical protein
MKQTIKYLKKYFWFGSILCAMLISGFSCSAPKPTPNPLTGFYFSSLNNLDSNKLITDDYKDYIGKLSPEEKERAGIEYFEDGTGQHAVKITIGLNGTVWEHVLIYDKDNKRIRSAIKHTNSGYRS